MFISVLDIVTPTIIFSGIDLLYLEHPVFPGVILLDIAPCEQHLAQISQMPSCSSHELKLVPFSPRTSTFRQFTVQSNPFHTSIPSLEGHCVPPPNQASNGFSIHSALEMFSVHAAEKTLGYALCYVKPTLAHGYRPGPPSRFQPKHITVPAQCRRSTPTKISGRSLLLRRIPSRSRRPWTAWPSPFRIFNNRRQRSRIEAEEELHIAKRPWTSATTTPPAFTARYSGHTQSPLSMTF